LIGKLQRVPLRDVWPHEARDFTVWLRDNLEELNEVTGLSLVSAEIEHSAGDFRIDLVAEDADGNKVVIENQLERSDHDHLGKLVTYVSNLDAVAAIWVVAEARQEHSTAVDWLNQGGGTLFYLVLAEAVRINDSLPAPLLTVIVEPSEEDLASGQVEKEKGERDVFCRRFWTALLDYAKTRPNLPDSLAPFSPGNSRWIYASTSKAGLGYNYSVLTKAVRVDLYIDHRSNDAGAAAEANVRDFEALEKDRNAIEAAFGEPLQWIQEKGGRKFRIFKMSTVGRYGSDEGEWPAIHAAMVDAMIRLEASFRPYIAKLPN
jgi:hypothetical protein